MTVYETKTILLWVWLFVFIAQKSHAQVVTATDYFPNGDGEITIIFDVKQSKDGRAAGLLSKTSDVFLWSGAGTSENGNAFEYQPVGQKNFNVPFEAGRMVSLGNDRWSIKIKPRDYYKVPANQSIKRLGLLLKSGDGKAQTEDFFLRLYGNSQLYISILKPLEKTIILKKRHNLQRNGSVFVSYRNQYLHQRLNNQILGEWSGRYAQSPNTNCRIRK